MKIEDPVKPWYTLKQLAGLLHRRPKTIRRLIRPYRDRCHLDRAGSHPRKVLWIPGDIAQKVAESIDR